MRTYPDCVPCGIRHALESVRMITDDERIHEGVLRETLRRACSMDLRQSPPATAQIIHRFIREVTNVKDPYLAVKDRYNKFALEIYPDLKQKIESSANPLETAVRLAVAGNIIDFGVNSVVEQGDVEQTITRSLTEPLDMGAFAAFEKAIEAATDILYLGDNAGEIVFDRMLIEQLPPEKVTFVVKGSPILNDALMEDARMVGMTDVVEVVDNGSDAPGTILESCSDEFRRRFDRADLIVAKGQGNFETLDDVDKNVFFMLRPKCKVLAEHLGCEIGELILRQSAAGTCRLGAKVERFKNFQDGTGKAVKQ
ncbi:MAG: DUF89 family protein [Phycisphaerales bacterium]|nr:MAG: DUF89 family protein [Phycisphaerales bacterium]